LNQNLDLTLMQCAANLEMGDMIDFTRLSRN
jgi:hypothetical protein